MEKKEKNRNPNNNNNKKKKKKKMEFELCKVCNLNHDQGRKHNYFPNHIKSLTSFLSRFLKKVSDVRFFLKNPTLLRPEHASRNRLWCVFCDSDIEELDSLFVCNNAIKHLASLEHLKNLKNFLWKYGDGMDRVDSFRVSESDLVQWENKCKALKNATTSSSGRSDGPHLGDLKDIHDTFYSDKLDNFKRNAIPSFELSISDDCIPLQKFTNEKIQVYHPKVFEVANIVPRPHETSFSVIAHSNMDLPGMHAEENIAKDLTVYRDNQQSLSGNCQTSSIGWYPIGEVGRPCNGESSNHVFQALTQITPVLPEESRANVHSGAPPPWFEKTEETQLNGQLHTESNRNGSRKSGKSQKLNPNRVGAAWAEKRKIELEMEKRGETVNNNCDANWLPNFGRVWQSGSRKESRKEFETENEKSHKTQILSEKPMIIQPYISKRMRRDSGDSKG